MDEFLTSLKNCFSPIQLIGYVGMICVVLSYQCKKNRHFFILQAACGLFFALQFALLGGFSGFLSNLFAIVRGVVMAQGERLRKRWCLWGIEAGFLLCFILSVTVFAEPIWVAFLLLVSQGGGTLVMWTGDGKKIRLFQVFAASPIWLVHNSIYTFSMGGILCEIFNVVSVLVSFLRFRRTGFEG